MINIGLEVFRSWFFAIDFFIGGLTPVAVYVLYRRGWIDRYVWGLFWLGFSLGLTWEIPMQVLNQLGAGLAVHGYVRPPPVPCAMIMIMHSFWDGGLFLLGVGLVRLVSGSPVFERFRWLDLFVLILWGQVSELWVELTSILGEAWFYLARPWTPSLFKFHGHDLTLLPQLIWLAAPIVFYFIALKARARRKPGEASPV